jgi:hypothetical protein
VNIVVEFKTKRNTEKNIMKTQTINYQKVFGKLEQETERFIISLEGDSLDVIEVFRNIWELMFLYDGYFYIPCKYIVDGADENVKKLFFLSFYNTGKTWRNCASTLMGADKDFSEERILKYGELRNKSRTSGDMLKTLINSFFYIHSEAYEGINVNHRLSLLLNICDGFVINTSGPNNNVKANIAKVIGTALDSKTVKYGAELLGIPSKKLYDALMLERHEIDHYIMKEGSLTDYEVKSVSATKDYINWYFIYIVELALRIAFLKEIGCECKDELVEYALNDINDWLILECDLQEKCKNPINQMKQDFKKMGISMT